MNSITVIIPIYNGTQAFKKLIGSLAATYPHPKAGLNFILLDDGSPDPALHEFYSLDHFFTRSDVLLHKRSSNLGFIKTVNEAVRMSKTGSDIVLLNSDTQVWTKSFEKLQEVSLRYSKVASLTPLTNQGTIASLFHWPNGLDIDQWFNPKEIAEQVERISIPTPWVPAPTGVGFCMFIPRKVWEIVGELSEAFGKGYGEECDWCQRAIQAGLENIICTETYVHHSGTASFNSEEKKRLIQSNSKLLEKRNPGYHSQVGKYVRQRPLLIECMIILVELVSHLAYRKNNSHAEKKDESHPASPQIFLFALHADPWSPESGGTEKHVYRLIKSLNHSYPVVCLFWLGNSQLKFKLVYRDYIFIEEVLHSSVLMTLLPILERWIRVLHVHHLRDWPNPLIDVLCQLSVKTKILTLHDYFFLCPSVNLLKDKKEFCKVEKDLESCNQCLKKSYGFWNLRIESYRYQSLARLRQFHTLLVPSPVVIDYFQSAFSPEEFQKILPRIQILEHDLNYILDHVSLDFENDNLLSLSDLPKKKKIAFIGHFTLHKGSKVMTDALETLKKMEFEVEIWGSCQNSHSSKELSQISVLSYKDEHELAQLFKKQSPQLIALPSICAETFSYVFYEALVLGQIPIIVGPFGNPAYIVRRDHVGHVMKTANGESFIESCVEVMGNYSYYTNNIYLWIQRTIKNRQSYLTSYLNLQECSNSWNIKYSHDLHLGLQLSQWNSLALRQENWFIKGIGIIYTRLQNVRGFQRIEKVVFSIVRDLWRMLRFYRQKWKTWVKHP